MDAPASPLVVRLVARSPRDRLQPGRGHRYSLECGYDDQTAATVEIKGGDRKEFGRMVSVLMESDAEMPEVLHLLADLWARQVRAQPNLRQAGEAPVVFDIVDGGKGVRTIHVEQLADWLHRMGDVWGERRAVRRALFRHNFRNAAVATTK